MTTQQHDHDDGPQIEPYSGVDDPRLMERARQSLASQYPSLTPDDIENLVGVECNRILTGGATDAQHTG